MAKNSLLQGVMVQRKYFILHHGLLKSCLCEWIWSLFCNSRHSFNFGVHMRLEDAATWRTNRFLCWTAKTWAFFTDKCTHRRTTSFCTHNWPKEQTQRYKHTHTFSAGSLAEGGITSIRVVRLNHAELCVLTKSWGAALNVSLPFSLSISPAAFPSTWFNAYFQFAH